MLLTPVGADPFNFHDYWVRFGFGFQFTDKVIIIHIEYSIIGHYNPSVRIIKLVSHTTYVVCVIFLYINVGAYSLKPTPNDKFLEQLFMAVLFAFRVFKATSSPCDLLFTQCQLSPLVIIR